MHEVHENSWKKFLVCFQASRLPGRARAIQGAQTYYVVMVKLNVLTIAGSCSRLEASTFLFRIPLVVYHGWLLQLSGSTEIQGR